jgi:hypothetical protein
MMNVYLEGAVHGNSALSQAILLLLILVLELLSAAIKNDPEITGVKINDSEYLLSQYADDSSLICLVSHLLLTYLSNRIQV